MMWKFLRGGATVIPGATFIPESRVGISKGSTMSWGGAQFIAVWMIVNQVGQIVCGPLELERRLERVHGPIMRWKNYQTNHTLGPKPSIGKLSSNSS